MGRGLDYLFRSVGGCVSSLHFRVDCWFVGIAMAGEASETKTHTFTQTFMMKLCRKCVMFSNHHAGLKTRFVKCLGVVFLHIPNSGP